ncbi:tetratricopeptide repeat protein [Algibacter sp. 2305UL17-15]|uniref:tetratricopeptide repeat protein n=1 Tax=Algibacter sp. 2305UL17-15 TaxID=3231268 RepID=UPI00345956EC
MRELLTFFILFITLVSFSQEKDKERLLAEKKANNYVYEANELVDEDFVSAEMEYRKALSKQSNNIAGLYNLGNSYYKSGNYEEALYRLQQTAKLSNSKAEKHKAFHNMGNILMKNNNCKEAVEAYKNALRNNPSDDETRYNLGLAQECAKKQEDENKDDKNKDDKEDKDNSEDKKDENKENKDDKDKGNEDNKDNENKDDKKENEEDKKDEGDKEDEKKNPEDKKDDKGKGDKDKEEKKQPQPQQGQLSPQQIKSLLEAMNNQEQKVQEKMNVEKQKGIKIKTEKDW